MTSIPSAGDPVGASLRAAVFASGGGSNLQCLLDVERSAPDETPWRIVLVVSDRESAGALGRAAEAGVTTRVIPVSRRDPTEVADETVDVLTDAAVDVVFLAGYLRLVPAPVVARWRRRILNVHPALLPSFGGKGMWGRHVHEAVLASGARVTGPTVHFVDEEYDEGTILAQWPVPVKAGDTPDLLAKRVLEAEHRLYPAAAAHLCRALLAGRTPSPLDAPGPHFGASALPLDPAMP